MDVSSPPPPTQVAVAFKPGFYWVRWKRVNWQPALVLDVRYAVVLGSNYPETLFVLGPRLEAPPDVSPVS